MTLNELLDLYARKRLKLASPNTLRLYRHSIVAFGHSLGRAATIDDLHDDALELHMARMIKDGLSIASANKDYAQITALWRFANRNRIVSTWPNVIPYREPEQIPLGWMRNDLEKLFAAIDQVDGKICGAPARMWWRCLLLVLLDSGERIGAIRKLERSHLLGDHLLVPSQFRKGNRRDKLFPLEGPTQQALKDLLALHRDQKLFPWDRSETYIYHKYAKILKSAGLSTDRRSKFHRIRRTVASAVACQGGNPTSAMDHANARTTKRYLDPRIVGEVSTANLVREWMANEMVK
ncbi:tyrosine-type recombinase/integrase [Pirellulaceae bacterium SH449]